MPPKKTNLSATSKAAKVKRERRLQESEEETEVGYIFLIFKISINITIKKHAVLLRRLYVYTAYISARESENESSGKG